MVFDQSVRPRLLERYPSRRSARMVGDEVVRAIIRRIWVETHRVYGPRNVWKQMPREGR
jgi:hypothetical protein